MNPSKRERHGKTYDDFIKKFELQAEQKSKNSDDCYTQPSVYEALLGYVRDIYDIPKDAPIVRPFYPGGDYEHAEYPDGCYVIDNPPFSKLTGILRFYNQRNIRYFLFAPTLTVLNYMPYANLVVAAARLTYENGAYVNTSFVHNLSEHFKIVVNPTLRSILMKADGMKKHKASHKKYNWPKNFLPCASLAVLAENGYVRYFCEEDLRFVRTVGTEKTNVFGGGLLISTRLAENIPPILRKRDALAKDIELTSDEQAAVEKMDGRKTDYVYTKNNL